MVDIAALIRQHDEAIAKAVEFDYLAWRPVLPTILRDVEESMKLLQKQDRRDRYDIAGAGIAAGVGLTILVIVWVAARSWRRS